VILGVDLGQKTTGLAISEGHFASPYQTIRHESIKEAVFKIAQICDELGVEKLVIGFVEGKIKSYFQNFAKDLKKKTPHTKVILWDETLTTRQARESMIKLGIAKLKRRKKEHEAAAAIILQSYINRND